MVERGREVARLVLLGDPEVAVTLEERVVAVALADQLGHRGGDGRSRRPGAARGGTRQVTVSDAPRRAPVRSCGKEVGECSASLKRLFVGRPLATTQMEEQRLPKTIALAVFSSDALSSTAYATEEILFVTALGASSLALGLSQLVPIAIVVSRAARDRDRVVPPGDLRLPQRRRRLRGEQGEHRRVRGRSSRARRSWSTTC